MRLFFAVVLGLAVPLCLAAPASAHGPQSLIHVTAAVDRGETVVTAAVSYLDGDPNVSSAITATARLGGQTVTIPMAKTSKAGVFAGRANLARGRWAFAVTASGESQGIGRTLFDVRPIAVASLDGSSPAIPGAAVLAAGAGLLLVTLLALAGGMARRRVRPAA
jgi:hypothetical protein